MRWDREEKGRAVPRRGFKPDFAAMPFHNSLAHGQTNAGAGIFFPCVQTLKDHEDPLRIFRFDADAIVVDGEHPLAALVAGGHMDAREVCAPELDGVGIEAK